MFKSACFFTLLVVGSIAFPLNEKDDMSFFFDNTIDPFIIGGQVKAEHVPHMVGLTIGIFSKSLMCGASIIGPSHVLTAAHCVGGVSIGNSLARTLRGNLGSNRWSSSRIEIRFSHGIYHPNYNHYTLKNDIGLLVTESPIVYSDVVQPIVLNFNFIGGGAQAIANGWGSLVLGEPVTQNLMELRPLTVDGERCISEVARVAAEMNRNVPPVDPEVELCTFFASNTGTCHGDSGSALVLEENKQQIGVVSWGVPCALGAPDMFARVSAYESWFKQHLQ